MLVGRRVPPLLLALALSPSLSSAQGLSTYRAQMWDEEQIGLPDAATLFSSGSRSGRLLIFFS